MECTFSAWCENQQEQPGHLQNVPHRGTTHVRFCRKDGFREKKYFENKDLFCITKSLRQALVIMHITATNCLHVCNALGCLAFYISSPVTPCKKRKFINSGVLSFIIDWKSYIFFIVVLWPNPPPKKITFLPYLVPRSYVDITWGASLWPKLYFAAILLYCVYTVLRHGLNMKINTILSSSVYLYQLAQAV